LLSYDRLSIKSKLFKSLTGITVQEFHEIYKKEQQKGIINRRLSGYPKEKKIEKEK
jgi:hypothetical protein